MLSRLAVKPSFAGTGLLERMRSTTFALLGITTAMGLGLVAVVSQQDWPFLPAAPLPALSEDGSSVDDAIEAGSASTGLPPASRAGRPRSAPPAGGRAGEPKALAPGSHLSGSRQLATAPSPPPANPVDGTPASPAEPSPVVAQAPGPSPAPASLPAAPPPAAPPPSASAPSTSGSAPSVPGTAVVTSSTHPGKGNAYGKQKPTGGSNGKSRQEPPAPAPTPVNTTAPGTTTTAASVVTAPPEAPVSTAKAPTTPEITSRGNTHRRGRGGI